MALFYFGKSRLFLPKVIGAFIIMLAIVMFIVAAGRMFDSWDAMKKYPDCLQKIGLSTDTMAMMQYLECKDSLYRITGLQLRADQQKITQRQFIITLLRPVAELLFWAAVFVLGLFMYNTRVVRPLSPLARAHEVRTKKHS